MFCIMVEFDICWIFPCMEIVFIQNSYEQILVNVVEKINKKYYLEIGRV